MGLQSQPDPPLPAMTRLGASNIFLRLSKNVKIIRFYTVCFFRNQLQYDSTCQLQPSIQKPLTFINKQNKLLVTPLLLKHFAPPPYINVYDKLLAQESTPRTSFKVKYLPFLCKQPGNIPSFNSKFERHQGYRRKPSTKLLLVRS